MNHPAIRSVNISMLFIGIAVIVGSYYVREDAKSLLLLIGCIFIVVNGGMLAYTSFAANRVKQLLEQGMLIQADFQQVEVNTSLKVNGASPFRLVAQWHDKQSNELRIFKSSNLWFDPSKFVEGRKLPVYIDRNNPAKYHMDLSFLPKVTGLA
jgi:hypothetical protein